jgi:hypothetical protein
MGVLPWESNLSRISVGHYIVLTTVAMCELEYYFNIDSFPPNNLSAGLPAKQASMSDSHVKPMTLGDVIPLGPRRESCNRQYRNFRTFSRYPNRLRIMELRIFHGRIVYLPMCRN